MRQFFFRFRSQFDSVIGCKLHILCTHLHSVCRHWRSISILYHLMDLAVAIYVLSEINRVDDLAVRIQIDRFCKIAHISLMRFFCYSSLWRTASFRPVRFRTFRLRSRQSVPKEKGTAAGILRSLSVLQKTGAAHHRHPACRLQFLFS